MAGMDFKSLKYVMSEAIMEAAAAAYGEVIHL